MLKPKALIITNAGVYLAALYPALMGAIFTLSSGLTAESEDLLEVSLETSPASILKDILFYALATFPIVAAFCIALGWSLYKLRVTKLAIYISFIPWINILIFMFAGLFALGT